jgi:L-asparaginase
MQVGTAKIVVLGTGGTIAGTAQKEGDNLGYQAAQLGVQMLLDAVPGLAEAAQGPMEVVQVAQVDSKDMDFAVWRDLLEHCAQAMDDPQVRAVVITHGTDTIEETAWFLQLVLNPAKPVVLTCAMRPATALVPDGPQNLLDAVALAATPGVRGVMVVAAGVVHDALHVQKVHAYRLDPFSCGEAGPLGWMEEGQVRWARKCQEVLVQQEPLAIKNIVQQAQALPRVDIVFNHAGADGLIVDALVASGTRGIVVAGTGNGTLHVALEAALLRAQQASVAVRVASRCWQGYVLAKPGDVLAHSQGLSPVKARVALQLALLAAQG